jgi:RNA polymerase sigma factor (sigma-70 family)
MSIVDADHEMADEVPLEHAPFEVVFRDEYRRIARVIARIVDNPARAEELAVEVFCKLLRNPSSNGPQVAGWLHKTAVRMGLDELRKQSRREKYERLFRFLRPSATPEQLHYESEAQERIGKTLSAIRKRSAEILILRSDGMSHDEIARQLGINPESVRTLYSRARQEFRHEYERRYGRQR